jgi:hypothetical protein
MVVPQRGDDLCDLSSSLSMSFSNGLITRVFFLDLVAISCAIMIAEDAQLIYKIESSLCALHATM